MKYIKRFFAIITLLVLSITYPIRIFAVKTGFGTEILSEEKKNSYISFVDVALAEEEPERKSITCFDVNENEMIAIGQTGSKRNIVCVYSKDGCFQYGFSFKSPGNFVLEWDENNINVYAIRGGIIFSVTPEGKISGIAKVPSNAESSSYTDSLCSRRRLVGNTEYTVENNMGILNLVAVSYSQLTVTDADGNKTVIYDVNQFQLGKYITWIFGIGVFIAIPAFTVIKNTSFNIRRKTKKP